MRAQTAKGICALIVVLLVGAFAGPATAQEEAQAEEGGVDLGSLWIGPRIGPALGLSGPRGGYLAGVLLEHRTAHWFYYNLEVSFLHLLPRTMTVGPTEQDGATVVPEHEVTITGLYGIPITMEIGARIPLSSATLRFGVGFGGMVTFQTLESPGNDELEYIGSFCLRPTVGLDFLIREQGLLRFDLAYLWQSGHFGTTGGSYDVGSLVLTVGYSFNLWG